MRDRVKVVQLIDGRSWWDLRTVAVTERVSPGQASAVGESGMFESEAMRWSQPLLVTRSQEATL